MKVVKPPASSQERNLPSGTIFYATGHQFPQEFFLRSLSQICSSYVDFYSVVKQRIPNIKTKRFICMTLNIRSTIRARKIYIEVEKDPGTLFAKLQSTYFSCHIIYDANITYRFYASNKSIRMYLYFESNERSPFFESFV